MRVRYQQYFSINRPDWGLIMLTTRKDIEASPWQHREGEGHRTDMVPAVIRKEVAQYSSGQFLKPKIELNT